MTLDEIVEVLARRFPYYKKDAAASRVCCRPSPLLKSKQGR